ncbi:tRNA (guanosine(46)-N(7))-methyltransferase TrmB [Bifidobacterium aquikefiricola]|uniref:tRNA (guanine-N(7)-)-methyltransferase n=1 Tax=Bifidobacterium aquikefiricola TaxID=3059038 RepID=A0AB39U8Y2_9BIFI
MDSHNASAEYAGRRSIVSYVRRSGHIDPRLLRAWDTYHDQYLIDLTLGAQGSSLESAEQAEHASLEVPQDFTLNQAFVRETWGTTHPLIVEVGSGQGENIVAAAASHPDKNFLALEVYTAGLAHTMLMAGKQGLTNLRVAQVNAPELLASCERGSVAEVWTFFPDPWPKMKHHKRRIIQLDFAQSIACALEPYGAWRIATDIDDYALHIHEVLDSCGFLRNDGNLAVQLPLEHVGKGTAMDADKLPHGEFSESSRFEGRVLTNFEQKGLKAGRIIHDFTYRAEISSESCMRS